MSRSKPKVDVAAGERTLIPFDEATRAALNPFEGDSAGRALVQLLDPEVTDSEIWKQTTDLHTGRVVLVRRADCGAGCRCAAEVKLVSYTGEGK